MNYQKTSLYGKYAIMLREGLSLKAYPDGEFYSIGFGHNGPDVAANEVITPYEAARLFETDISRFELLLNESVTVALKQQQFDALASLAYNIGIIQFSESTLLKKLNQGYDITEEWHKWKHVHESTELINKLVISNALVARRKEEVEQFLS